MPLAFVGEAGTVILFVSLLATVGLLGSLVLVYAAHCFLVVVQDTAAGIDEVVWPTEPAAEWLGRGALLGWQMLVWLAPLGMFLRASKVALEPAVIVLLAGIVLWIFFPIGVLSSLSGPSRWAFFRPRLLTGLVRIGPTTLGFYLATPLLLAAGLGVWYFALTASGWLVPVAAGVGAAAVLIYARLLGRVAWSLNHLKKPKKRRPRLVKMDLPPLIVQSEDPWTAPPTKPKKQKPKPKPQPTEIVGEEVYGLSTEAEPPSRPHPVEVPLDGYAPIGEPPPAALPPWAAPDLPQASDLEMRLAQRTPQAIVPPHPLFSGVYTFPWYASSLQAWTWLAVGGTLVGLLLRIMPGLPG